MDIADKIKDYLKRLGNGESLEAVRSDFVKEFQSVDASEIMLAEQRLLKEGTPLQEVQRLCDVHSALFHETVKENKTENPKESAAQLAKIPGHPIAVMVRENQALKVILDQCRHAISNGFVGTELLDRLREISIHYAKKGDLLYPHLKVQYKIEGPSAVMWTVDDEIRDELNRLAGCEQNQEWLIKFSDILKKIEEMIFKEENILFQNCAKNFCTEEWYGIYQDAKDYDECFGVKQENWQEAENSKIIRKTEGKENEIRMPGGHMTVEQLTAMLNAIPLEITFVDVENKNRYFNEGPKFFKRPGMAIDREVFSCHPPKVEAQVRRIIEEFRKGTRDEVLVFTQKKGKDMLVSYRAVRDEKNQYIGTVELVQDLEVINNHLKKK